MPRKNNILIRSGTTAPTATDFNVGEPAWDKTGKKFYIKAGDNTMVEIGAGAGGATEIYEYATTANFPATGSAAVLYLATDYGRVYRWTGSTGKYAEVGTLSANTPAASLQAVGNSGTTKTLAPSDLYGGVLSMTLTGNCTVTMPALAAGQRFTLLLSQDSTGGRTCAFTDVRWANGSAPTITTTKSATDVITFHCDGTYWLGSITQAHATYAFPSVDYLVVAGGGAGGYDYGGGGGGGGVRYGTTTPTPGSALTVTVGAGGTAGTGNQSGNGADSVFSSITSTGGGGGGRGANNAGTGANGGSGGGAGGRTSSGTNAGGTATPVTSPVQGYAGGSGTFVSSATNDFPAGGGGGATAAGTNGVAGQSGAGGAGYTSSISGTSTVYGAGGGAGGYSGASSAPTAAGAAGGSGAGAGSGGSAQVGGAASANQGGGGGGASGGGPSLGGAGGSGVVILKFADSFSPTVSAGLTYTSSTSGGYKIYKFTAGTGTITF